MKLKGCVVLMTLCCLAAPVAAEEKPVGPPPPRATRDFATVKQQVLQRIDQRLLKLHQEQDCVKAANNRQELNACRPKKHTPRGQAQPAVAPPPSAAPMAPTPAQ